MITCNSNVSESIKLAIAASIEAGEPEKLEVTRKLHDEAREQLFEACDSDEGNDVYSGRDIDGRKWTVDLYIY